MKLYVGPLDDRMPVRAAGAPTDSQEKALCGCLSPSWARSVKTLRYRATKMAAHSSLSRLTRTMSTVRHKFVIVCLFTLAAHIFALNEDVSQCEENCAEPNQNTAKSAYRPELLVVTVATERTEGYERFLASAEREGLKVETLGLDEEWRGGNVVHSTGGGHKVNLLRTALEEFKDRSDLLIMFVDSYDVIFTGGQEQILKKFYALDADAIFSAEGFCWPDASLKDQYPASDGEKYLNSGGFIGWAPVLYKIVTHTRIKDDDDDQLFYTKIYLDPALRSSLRIRLDNTSSIFQNLNGAVGDVSLSEDVFPKVRNTAFGTEPVVIHGNGPSKVALNSLANYLAGAWKTGEGCLVCEDRVPLDDDHMPTVTIAVFVEEPTPFFDEFLDNLLALEYPKEKISIVIHKGTEYHNERLKRFVEHETGDYAKLDSTSSEGLLEVNARERALRECLANGCDYFFNLDSRVHLTNRKVLQHLIAKGRNFIAPLVVRSGQAWSNFWGALTSDGFYARSHDYMEIVKGDRRGIWNVPYVGEVYLLRSAAFKDSPPRYVNGALDPDMAFCKNLRERGIFMYVDNLEDFGFLINTEHFDTTKLHPDFYEIYNNQFAWGLRYIHEEYKDIFENKTGVLREPCPDVFWFPLVSPKFCEDLIGIMENHGGWSDGTNSDPRLAGGYENVPTRDIHMKQVGFEPQWLFFLREYVRPVQELVFTGYHHDPPKAIMNFVVRYRPDEQPSLRAHHDASTYTLNLSLNRAGRDYTGGGSRFIRQNCSVTGSPEGWGILHPGRLTHYHEGLTTTNGTRYIMVSFVDP